MSYGKPSAAATLQVRGDLFSLSQTSEEIVEI
jgi:hypothetical protein